MTFPRKVKEYQIEQFGRIDILYSGSEFYTRMQKMLDFPGIRDISSTNIENLEKKLSEELNNYLEAQKKGVENSIDVLKNKTLELDKVITNIQDIKKYCVFIA